MDDVELLREYVERQSEKAFAELVAHYINLVYSTALRMVQETTLAEDVAQAVFIQLARKAPTIRSGNALPGWLYHVTRCQAANAVRDDHTRRQRETEAMNMAQTNGEPYMEWNSIAPCLEEAMSTLSDVDQNAVLQRFFQGRSWREVGAALALSEDAAQKRVSRALNKLRAYLVHRGITASASVIGLTIAANAVQAAPASLAASVLAKSLAAGAAAGTSSLAFSLTKLTKLIIMNKNICITTAIVVLVAAISIPVLTSKGQPAAPSEKGLREGLVLHLTFDQMEADGRTTDASGLGNHGWVTGANWTNEGKRGGAYRFTPPNEFIRVPNNDSLNPSQITLAAWIKTSRNDDIWRRVFDKSYNNGYAMSIGGGHTPGSKFKGLADVEIGMKLTGNKSATWSDRVVTDGQWHQVVSTYNGLEECLYVDGVRQKRVAHWEGRVPANTHDLTIGINLVDPDPKFDEVGSSFDGTIDEPMIWNRALSEKEVAFLFESQR